MTTRSLALTTLAVVLVLAALSLTTARPARALMPNLPTCPSCTVRLRPELVDVLISLEAPAGVTFSAPSLNVVLADGTTQTLMLDRTGATYRAGVPYVLTVRAPAAPIGRVTLAVRSSLGPLWFRLPISGSASPTT